MILMVVTIVTRNFIQVKNDAVTTGPSALLKLLMLKGKAKILIFIIITIFICRLKI